MLPPPPSLTPSRPPGPGVSARFAHLVDASPAGGGVTLALARTRDGDEDGLEIVLEASSPSPATRLGLLLDPVGDGESFFEIALEGGDRIAQVVFRRSPGGYKRDWRWQCDGLEWKAEPPGHLRLTLPFRGLGSTPPHDGWRANFFSLPPGEPPAAWSPTGWNTLYQPDRFGFLRLG